MVKLVGEARSRFDETGDRMDPCVGVRLIRAVHHDEGMEGQALDDFLAEARKMADAWRS